MSATLLNFETHFLITSSFPSLSLPFTLAFHIFNTKQSNLLSYLDALSQLFEVSNKYRQHFHNSSSYQALQQIYCLHND